jgi:cardiolipin synthase
MRGASRWVWVAGAVASLCVVGGLLVSNFVGGETKIERRIERLYVVGPTKPPESR